MPLDWLAVQPRAYPERKYYSRGGVGKPEGFVIASKSNDMGDYAEHGIVVHKEGIGFAALGSVSLSVGRGFPLTVAFASVVIWSSSSEAGGSEPPHRFFCRAGRTDRYRRW